MKRFSCVSALLVGLSLTVASSALAAPPAPPAKAKKGVVKPKTEKKAKQAPEEKIVETKATPETTPADSVVQAADPPPADGAGGTPTTPAPATEPAPATDPNANPATTEPAVSVGTTPATTSDSPSDAPPAPTAPPKPRPWAGSNIFAFTSMTTATIFKQQQNDYNPTVDSSIWLAPRYAINKDFQLRGLAVFNYEFTNGDDTVTRNEPRFSDTTVSLFYRSIPEVATIKPMVALNAGLPTSPESRARTMIVNPGVTLQLSKTFENFLGGELLLLSSTVYAHPIYSNRNSQVRGDFAYNRQCTAASTECAGQLSGAFNPSDTLTYSFMVSPSWGKWSPAIFYRGRSIFDYTGTKEVTANDVQPGLGNQPISSGQDGGATRVRQTSYFSVWLDYNANAWLTAEVGYWLDRSSVLTEGSRYGNPLFDRYQDMRVYIGASFQIDNILKALEGGSGEAGIVRAQNTKQPMWNF